MTGFGLAFPRKEGAAVHPDDPICGGMSDELYVKQLRAYLADNVERPEGLFLSRPKLLARSITDKELRAELESAKNDPGRVRPE